jgi:hypothetical protein
MVLCGLPLTTCDREQRYAPCALRYAVYWLWLEERTLEQLKGESDQNTNSHFKT